MAEPPTVDWALKVMTQGGGYNAGLGGTCCDCRFATGPVNKDGSLVADPNEYNNDPTEAYYQCGLPTRDKGAKLIDWGEYAPCNTGEWARWLSYESARIALKSVAMTVRLFGPIVKWDAEGVELFLTNCMKTLDPNKVVGGDG